MKLRLEERVVAERERFARELHDTLLQSFQGSLFEVQAARNLFSRRPGEAIRSLDEAILSAETAIVEGRDAIRNLHSGSGDSSDLAHLLAAVGHELSVGAASNGGSPAFRVTVKEPRHDGTGIDPKVLHQSSLAGHWGLPGVSEPAKLAGMEVQHTVPALLAYPTPAGTGLFRAFRKKSRS